VVHEPHRDILWVEELSTIWRCFPRDMRMLMHHIVSVINLIDMLRGGSHDPTTSSSSVEPSTSSTPPHSPPYPPSNSPLHESVAASTDPLTSPPHVSEPTSTSDPPPHVSPPHVSEPISMYNTPPPPSSSYCFSSTCITIFY